LQSGDWGGATAPARRFHRLSVYRGSATAPARRCHRPRLGGSTAWPIQPKPNGPCLSPNLAQ
ncbi:unnamed protein product, partial [Musa textilis]